MKALLLIMFFTIPSIAQNKAIAPLFPAEKTCYYTGEKYVQSLVFPLTEADLMTNNYNSCCENNQGILGRDCNGDIICVDGTLSNCKDTQSPL